MSNCTLIGHDSWFRSFHLEAFQPFRLLFQCRYSGNRKVADVNTVPPPLTVAAPRPLRVELRLANGQCFAKGYVERKSYFSLCRYFEMGLDLNVLSNLCRRTTYSYYNNAEHPETKVLREPVCVELCILERIDPNIVLTLGCCWATSNSGPQSLPLWDLLVNG